MDTKDFQEEISKQAEKELRRRSEWEIKEEVKKRLKEEGAHCLKIEALISKAGLGYEYRRDPEAALVLLEDMVTVNLGMKRIKEEILSATNSLNRAIERIER